MRFGILCTSFIALAFVVAQRWESDGLREDVQALQQQEDIIMTALDDLKAAAARLESVSAAAGHKLDADAATIKDDVTKLAALAAAPQPASDADLKAISDRINAVAYGLSGHLAPVTDAAGQVAAAAPAT